MPPVPSLTCLANRFADMVWERPVDAVDAWAAGFAADCAKQGVELQRIVEAQPDETLALAVQKGVFVKDAFVELLVNRYGPKLQGWFVHHGRRYGRPVSYAVADELVQEIWYRQFVARFGSFDASQGFGPFLFVVSRNLFVQRVLRARRNLPLAGWDGCSRGDTVGQDIELDEVRERLEGVIDRLSSDHREALLLAIAGYAPQEIAGMLGVPVKTVYRRLFHARRRVEQGLSGVAVAAVRPGGLPAISPVRRRS